MYVSANANARSRTSASGAEVEAVARVRTPRRAHDATRGSETCPRDRPRMELGGATAVAAAEALIEVIRLAHWWRKSSQFPQSSLSDVPKKRMI